jgi:hypothetical protein
VLAAGVTHHPHAADAEPGEPREFTLWNVVAHQRDAAKPLGIFGQHVGEHHMVPAIAARADDDAGAHAELVLQGEERLGQRVRRDIGTVRRKRIFERRSEQMDVGVAGVRRGFELGLLRMGIGARRQFRHSGAS